MPTPLQKGRFPKKGTPKCVPVEGQCVGALDKDPHPSDAVFSSGIRFARRAERRGPPNGAPWNFSFCTRPPPKEYRRQGLKPPEGDNMGNPDLGHGESSNFLFGFPDAARAERLDGIEPGGRDATWRIRVDLRPLEICWIRYPSVVQSAST